MTSNSDPTEIEFFYKAAELGLQTYMISAGLIKFRLGVSDELSIKLMRDLEDRGLAEKKPYGPRPVLFSSIDEVQW